MNMINIFREYIKYQLNAKRRHGIHSPFVYDFGDKCLKSTVSKDDLRVFKQLKLSFLKDNIPVRINDPYVPSGKSNQSLPIRRVIKMIEMDRRIGKLLFRISSYYPIKKGLELGTGIGLGTFMLSSGNKEANIITIEPNQDLFNFAKDNFPPSRKKNVEFINGSFIHYLKSQENSVPFDLVLINGNQLNINDIKKSLTLLEPLIHDETIILINGIRRNKETFEIWEELMNKSEYHLSIDLFRAGILFKRHHQEKEHFVIRLTP